MENGKSGNGEDKLKIHNQYIIEQIKKTKEYSVYSKIKVLHEELMKKAEDEKKRELYEHQYTVARNIFTKRIEVYNQNWKKIEEE